jgi:hypothetical protein
VTQRLRVVAYSLKTGIHQNTRFLRIVFWENYIFESFPTKKPYDGAAIQYIDAPPAAENDATPEVTTSVPECHVNGMWVGGGEGKRRILIDQSILPTPFGMAFGRLKLSPQDRLLLQCIW